MALMSRSTHDPKLTRWWWRTLREWVYELVDPLWAAFRGENSDEIALANVTGINDVSASELAILDGLTATNTELNKLSGLTAEASELNKADRAAADGIAESSRNVVLDASKDILGKRYDINQSLLEAVAGGPSFKLDGASSEVIIPDDDDLDFGTGDFTIAVRAIVGDFVNNGSTYNSLLGKSHIVVGPGSFYVLAVMSDNKMRFILNSTASQAVSDGAINDGKVHHIVGARSSGIIRLYVDGILQTDTGSNSNSVTNGDDLYIGNDGSSNRHLNSTIYDVSLFNRALSVDDIKALASGAPVDYADVGANQADLVTNGEDWTGATGSTPPNNWGDSGPGTATYIIRDNTPVANFGDDKALELNASGGSKTLYQGVAQAGKRYRVSFVYRNLDGSSSSYVALGSSDNKVTLQNTGISGDGIVFEQELLADGTDLKFFVDTNGTLQIDHVQVVLVGCVAAYLPDGITHAQWQDASGNELHGSVNGAIPLNLPSGHVARYIKQGITGDTTLSAAVPAGYRIKSMVAEVSGAGAGMRLNIGTSAGGTDVVNNQDISSNGLFDLTVAKNIFSLSSAQSLYVNDDGGTAWSGVSVDLYIDLERVK